MSKIQEITYANMFMKALDAMDKLDHPFFGNIPRDDTADLEFDLSQGEDARGPWNEVADFEYIADQSTKHWQFGTHPKP